MAWFEIKSKALMPSINITVARGSISGIRNRSWWPGQEAHGCIQFFRCRSRTASLVTVPEDGFDDDLAEEDEIVSEGGLEILSD